MKNTILIVLALFVAFGLGYGAVRNTQFGAPALVSTPFGAVTSASSTVATTTSLAVSSNASRIYLSITNDGSNSVYCTAATSTGFVSGEGWRINANGGDLLFDGTGNMFVGSLYCLTASGTSTLSTAEK